MITIISISFTIVAMLLMVPLLTLLLQAVAATFLKEPEEKHFDALGLRTAILIPAHNEALSIATTIESLKEQMSDTDRIVVVADNCSDDTGSIATSLGAEVVTRIDNTRIGKGYALDAGMRHLARVNPPDIVVILDGDCILHSGSLSVLAEECTRRQAPVQAMYTMAPSPHAQGTRVAEFAWRIKGVLRPIGFMRLDLPCQLKGTGMAFPWTVLESCNLATGHITEDLLLGVELALQGKMTAFCSRANVVSQLPASRKGRQEQRERWIHGYFSVVRQHLPRLFLAAARRRDIALLALACDLAVPPLVVLGMLCGLSFLASTLWYGIAGEIAPLAINASNIALLTIFLILAWFYCGRDLIGRKDLVLVPQHFAAVLQIVFAYRRGGRREWNRAERKK